MDVSRFTRDELILAGIALLLAIDLLFLPWFDISIGIGAFKVSATSGATESPDGWLGVLAMMAYLALERLGNVELPAITGSPATTRFALAAAAAGFVALKFLFHIHFSLSSPVANKPAARRSVSVRACSPRICHDLQITEPRTGGTEIAGRTEERETALRGPAVDDLQLRSRVSCPLMRARRPLPIGRE